MKHSTCFCSCFVFLILLRAVTSVFPPKRLALPEIYFVTTQRTVRFIITAVKFWNPKQKPLHQIRHEIVRYSQFVRRFEENNISESDVSHRIILISVFHKFQDAVIGFLQFVGAFRKKRPVSESKVNLLSVSIPVAPTWSTGHPWNASFHFSFLILVCRTSWTSNQLVVRPLSTHKNGINADKYACL
jgi:hypothetical protein